MIIQPISLLSKIQTLYDKGLPPGHSTGWKTLDQHYTVAPGQWSLFTGIPGHGKSEFLDALMVNLAEKWRFAIFSPENHPLEMHCAKIIEKVSQKPFGAGPNERIEREDLEDAVNWMQNHFMFIKTQSPNLRDILNLGVEKVGNSVSQPGGIVIDPWNQLEHYRPAGMSETEYISQALSDVIWYAREHNVHIWVVAHPQKLQRDTSGKRPVPTPYDVSGSAHWYNKADNCLAVWRDVENRNSPVQVHVQKIRFKNIGKVGVVDFHYDHVTGCYVDIDNRAPVYSLGGHIAI